MPTTLVADAEGTTYRSDPVDATDAKRLAVQPRWEAFGGDPGTVEVWLETSADLVAWTDLTSPLSVLLAVPFHIAVSDPGRFVRLAFRVAADAGEIVVVVGAKATARGA